jgi:hypothetical protein
MEVEKSGFILKVLRNTPVTNSRFLKCNFNFASLIVDKLQNEDSKYNIIIKVQRIRLLQYLIIILLIRLDLWLL